MEPANLPPFGREMIDHGFSAKKILATRASGMRLHRRNKRLAADAETGALSKEIADVILDFCRAKDGVPETVTRAEDFDSLLNETKIHLGSLRGIAVSHPSQSDSGRISCLNNAVFTHTREICRIQSRGAVAGDGNLDAHARSGDLRARFGERAAGLPN